MLMQLLILSVNIFYRMLREKLPFKMKTLRFYITYSQSWSKYLAYYQIPSVSSSKSLYMRQWVLLSYVISIILSKVSYTRKTLMFSLLELCCWDYLSYRIMIWKPGIYNERTYQKARKKWKAYSIIKAFCISLRSSIPNGLIVTIMTYWLAILESKHFKSW